MFFFKYLLTIVLIENQDQLDSPPPTLSITAKVFYYLASNLMLIYKIKLKYFIISFSTFYVKRFFLAIFVKVWSLQTDIY